MSSTRQHFQNFSGGRFPLRKQKSISDTTAVNKSNESKRLLHRQSSVDSKSSGYVFWSLS